MDTVLFMLSFEPEPVVFCFALVFNVFSSFPNSIPAVNYYLDLFIRIKTLLKRDSFISIFSPATPNHELSFGAFPQCYTRSECFVSLRIRSDFV